MTTPVPVPTSPPVVAIERQLRWRVLPTLMFITCLGLLAVVGWVSLTMAHRHPHGLPDDPDSRAAAALVTGRVSVPTNALRFRSALLGGEPANRAADAAMLLRAKQARARLDAVRRRHPGEPRLLAAVAALDLAAHDYARAARRYRRACEMAPHYGEGRLGAGVALALDADRTPEPWQSRALRLQAIAQFAMVDSSDAEYMPALYDRALVLHDVGRQGEAAFYAGRYVARDGGSAWTAALRQGLATP